MSILITGGTGSLGHSLVAYLVQQYPERKVIVYSRDEQKQAAMATHWPVGQYNIRYMIGDVRDENRLAQAMAGVNWVIHAAAMKIVPTCEYNPWEAVRTNVVGTWNVIQACLRAGVERAILVSSDKGVSPINLYGATKLCAEKMIVHANVYSGGIFSAVRYGNVMGSRGSVLPLFRQCVAEGRPFPITDERMTRFWLTLPEAVEFVMSSLRSAIGGEVFVPKLRACRIVDLARAIDSEREAIVVGIRPGEKLHELLLGSDEGSVVDIGNRLVVLPRQLPRDSLSEWYSRGELWPENMAYGSDTAPQIPIDELRRMVGGE